MSGVFDKARQQVEDQQSNRSDMLASMEMPEQVADQFAGKSVEELKAVDMKSLSPVQAKQWAAAMESAQDAPPAMPAPAPAPVAAEQPTEVSGAF
jgi:hypothetical protein